MEVALHIEPSLAGRVWRHACVPNRPPLRTHRHRELEINLVTGGSASYLVGDRRRVAMRPRTLLWLFPAQDHVLLEQTPDFQMWILVFKPELLRRVCTSASTRPLRQSDPGTVLCTRLSSAATRRLVELYRDVEAAHDAAVHNAGLGFAALASWSAHLAADEMPDADDVHPAVERAAALLRDDPDVAGVDDLARRCGLSASRLSRLFREQTGVGLIAYRNQRRVERFLDLYGAGQRLKMTDAALRAGFGSYPQFHRAFKRVVGCGPAEYRRRLRSIPNSVP